MSASTRTSRSTTALTLLEVLVAVLILSVVTVAMLGVLFASSTLFQQAETSRAANDEAVAVMGALQDDLDRLLPAAADGFVYAALDDVNDKTGNAILAWSAAAQNSQAIGLAGGHARELVAWWADADRGADKYTANETNQRDRLRRLVLDDALRIGDFVLAEWPDEWDQVGSVIFHRGPDQITPSGIDVEWFHLTATGQRQNDQSFSLPGGQTHVARAIIRQLTNQFEHAEITVRFGNQRLTKEFRSSVIASGCLHFGCAISQDAARRNTDGTLWWNNPVGNANGSLPPISNNFDTAASGTAYPAAIQVVAILSGGGRFAAKGFVTADLDANSTDLRFAGFKAVPSAPGSLMRIDDEWVEYGDVRGGTATGLRGALGSVQIAHPRGATVRIGRIYSLVRVVPR